MNGIFNANTISKFKSIRSVLFKIAAWTFVAGVVMGVFLILFGGLDNIKAIGRVLGTLFVLSLAMMVSANNFRRLEDRHISAQIFALVGLVMNVVWAFLWILAVWGAFDLYAPCEYDNFFCYSGGFSTFGKLAIMSSYISALGFFGSNIMSIKDENKRSTIMPLKVTAVICLAYEFIYATINILVEIPVSEMSVRFGILSGFTAFVWVVTTIVALIFSRQAHKATPATNNASPDKPVQTSEEQIRAEIEEKVKREMIEKEVRERMAKEAAEPAQPTEPVAEQPSEPVENA